ncbi:MAG: hypothetical protein IPL65_10585 [Lewinellaceae bacterium]|nr:hypothetical protein [Lewinellaceae bacterium]
MGDVISNQTCANKYTITRTYRATDVCGNSGTCAQIITVFDNTPPGITCPANVTVTCANLIPTPNTAAVLTSDNCGGTVTVTHVGDMVSNQICTNQFTLTRTYRATDLCGNSATCTQVITVFDNTPPNYTCPANITVSCTNLVPVPNSGPVPTGDNCDGNVMVTHLGDVISNQTCANRYTISRTYQATDLCGYSVICTQIITVFDNTAPSITCPASLTVSCANQVPPVNTAAVVASDNCGDTVTVIHLGDVISNQSCTNRFTVTRTYRATDLCGNSATCVQVITVFDNTGPVFSGVPANLTIECKNGPPPPVMPTAMDECGGGPLNVTFTQTQTPGDCPVAYYITRTWSATDICGNIGIQTQVITIVDLKGPAIEVLPVDVLVPCGPNNMTDYQNWLSTLGGAVASDCSTFSWSYTNTPGNFPGNDCGNTFGNYIRFIATDKCGNTSFSDAHFLVYDEVPPTFTVMPKDTSVDCMADCNGEIDFYNWLDSLAWLQVEDNCGEVTLEWGLSTERELCGNTWSKTYFFRATDQCGNSATKYATFAVIDTTPPLITCPPDLALTCEFDVPAPDPSSVTAWDECGIPIVQFENENVYGVGCGYFPQTVVYTYAAIDECGNKSICYQTFQVNDTIPPVYFGPDTIEVACIADLPGPNEAAQILGLLIVDNCYDVICFNTGMPASGTNWVTYTVKAKDLCVNWTDLFNVTFIATGGCKPLCSFPMETWGNGSANIGGLQAQKVVKKLLETFGPLTVGRANRTIATTDFECVFALLPGAGPNAEFTIGNFEATVENGCSLPAYLMNFDGSLANSLAAQTMTLQLNIWYNIQYNERQLGYQPISGLPSCIFSEQILSELGPNATIQNLLQLANNYLAGVGYFTLHSDKN